MAKTYVDRYGTRRVYGVNYNVRRDFAPTARPRECFECSGVGGHFSDCAKAQ